MKFPDGSEESETGSVVYCKAATSEEAKTWVDDFGRMNGQRWILERTVATDLLVRIILSFHEVSTYLPPISI